MVDSLTISRSTVSDSDSSDNSISDCCSRCCCVDPIPTLTSGAVEYPTPPLLIVIEEMVPAVETTAVAAAPVNNNWVY